MFPIHSRDGHFFFDRWRRSGLVGQPVMRLPVVIDRRVGMDWVSENTGEVRSKWLDLP